MFRTSQGPSSGSHKLFLTEVTGFGCAASVWLHILTLGVCVCRIGQGCTLWRLLKDARWKSTDCTKIVQLSTRTKSSTLACVVTNIGDQTRNFSARYITPGLIARMERHVSPQNAQTGSVAHQPASCQVADSAVNQAGFLLPSGWWRLLLANRWRYKVEFAMLSAHKHVQTQSTLASHSNKHGDDAHTTCI
jgi:hypothetical protein